jgi:hypothetical protein
MPGPYQNMAPAQSEPMPWEPDTQPAAAPVVAPEPVSLEPRAPQAPADATAVVPRTPSAPQEPDILAKMFPSAAKAIQNMVRPRIGDRVAPGGELKNIRAMVSGPLKAQGGLGPFTPPQYGPMTGEETEPLKVALGVLQDVTTMEGRAWGAISPTQEFGDADAGFFKGAREGVQKWTDNMQEHLLQEMEADPSLRTKIANRYAIGAAEVENFIAQSALTFAENPLTALLLAPFKGASLLSRAFHGAKEAAGLERKLQFGFESAPPPGMATTANYDELLTAHKKSIAPIILPDGAQNKILVETGLKPAATFDAPGIYKGVVSPNTRYEFGLTYNKKQDANLSNRVRVATEAHRRLFDQEAVGYYHPLRATPEAAQGIAVDIGRTFTDKELRAISESVKKSIGADISGSPYKRGLDIFADDVDPQKLMEAVKTATEDLGLSAKGSYFKRGQYSDLIFEPQGKEIENAFRNSAIAGRSFDVVDDIRNRLQAEAAEAAVAAEGARKAAAGQGPVLHGELGPRPGAKQLDETIQNVIAGDADAARAIFKKVGLGANPGQDTKKLFMHYPLEGIKHKLDEYLQRSGWTYGMFGGKYGPADFKKSYPQKNVWIYDPSAEKGSFFDEEYTKMWRVPHEIAHGETNEILTKMYGGQGKRLGALGVPTKFKGRDVPPLSLADAMRALDWEDLAFRRQREIYEKEFGIKISDADFNSEYAGNMADALHRVLSGEFSDPGVLGILPKALSPKQVLKDAKKVLMERADDLGLDKSTTFKAKRE